MNRIEETIQRIDITSGKAIRARARARLEQLTMPLWALGKLMDLAERLAEMTRSLRPPVARRTIVVMAGDHGVAKEGTSAYPQEVTTQMVGNFVAGGAGINALARQAGAQVVVVDMGVCGDLQHLVREQKILSYTVGPGTANMTVGPAMSREQAIESITAGIDVAHKFADSTDLYGTGDMGIGNTTPSSAIVSLLCGAPVEKVTGRGTGLGDQQLLHKIKIIEKSLQANTPDPSDAVDVLAKVGGFEIGAIAGLILGAAGLGKPILIDGFISTAGALLAAHLAPSTKRYMISAHQSVEPGHRIALHHLGLHPLLDLELRLGEGTGCALAMHLVEAACRVLTEVATFEEAGVSEAN